MALGIAKVGKIFGTVWIFSTALHAQSIAGTWQGTLPGGDSPRIVLKMVKSEDGLLRGGVIRIDLSPDVVLLDTVSFVAPDLSLYQTSSVLHYQGKLSVDGKSFDGTWTQDKQSYPLMFVRATPETLWKSNGPVPLPPMSYSADPSFEVAVVKPGDPNANRWGFSTSTRQFHAMSQSLMELITFAYDVERVQVLGAAPWMDKDRFDIVGKPDAEGLPSTDQYRVMLRKLLAERFGLKVHEDDSARLVYALTVVKNPPNISKSNPELIGPRGMLIPGDGRMLFRFSGDTMAGLIDHLTSYISDHPIVDETGLTGLYDYTLSPPANVMSYGPNDERAAVMFQAVQDIGLKLVPKKEPVKMLVIERAERPSAN